MTTKLSSLYDQDYATWTENQAKLLRERKFDAIDIDNIAEEIESLGKRDRRELSSRLIVLLMHLLKWQFQPGKRSNSWKGTINEQRYKISRILDDSPSLHPYLLRELPDCYSIARDKASGETGLGA